MGGREGRAVRSVWDSVISIFLVEREVMRGER